MTYSDLIKHFGSQGAVARAIGISQPSVCEWQDNGVPENRQLEIQKITGGTLKADPEIIEKYRAIFGVASERAA